MNAADMLLTPIKIGERTIKQLLPDDVRDTMPYFPQFLNDHQSTDKQDGEWLLFDRLTTISHELKVAPKQDVLHILQGIWGHENGGTLLNNEDFIKDLVPAVLEIVHHMDELEESIYNENIQAIREMIKQYNEDNTPSKYLKDQPILYKGSYEALHEIVQVNVNEAIAEKTNETIPVSHPKQQSHEFYLHILNQFHKSIQTIQHGEDLVKVAPKIMDLLKMWTRYESNLMEIHQMKLSLEYTDANSEILRLWESLVHTFKKRNELATKNVYNRQAKVTSVDVVKWMRESLNTSNIIHTTTKSTPYTSNSFTSMTPVEQYVIHMQQHPQTEVMERQLISQFRQIMQTRPLMANHGLNQLSISLKPEHLGDMLVRFIEMNGEMTVKILVTSQATKKLIEANLSQLKHMFSPHQVVIEKQDHELESVPADEHLKENNDDQTHQHADDERQQSNSQNAGEDFQQLLNEKV